MLHIDRTAMLYAIYPLSTNGGILVIVRHFMPIILCACAFTPSKVYAQHGLASNRLRAGADLG